MKGLDAKDIQREIVKFIYTKILKYNWSAKVEWEDNTSISIKLSSNSIVGHYTRVVLAKNN